VFTALPTCGGFHAAACRDDYVGVTSASGRKRRSRQIVARLGNGPARERRLAVSHPRLPVILMTAHASDDEVRVRSLRDGAADYLAKPLDEETVLRAIETVLRAK
jgi:FixJ family two-component response regulator